MAKIRLSLILGFCTEYVSISVAEIARKESPKIYK